jgi:Flp pilus assembly protein TadD
MSREGRIGAWAALGISLLGAVIYGGTLQHPFVFDDLLSIVEAEEIESLWPPGRAFEAPPGSGQSGRPLVALSLALNYWLAGRAVLGFHLVNILGHIAAALALLCVARRCLVATGEASGAAATGLAFAIAAVWVSHPLHSDAIGHIIYRNETLMALFYFLTLYGALRAFEGEKKWLILAPLACLASMACKEVAVSLPLMVFGFDVFFGAKSARAAFAKRGAFYAALAFSWIGLAFFVASGERGDSVGLGHADVVGVADYLRTQMIAVPIYLRLTFVPWPLIFDYHDGVVVRHWQEVWLPGVLLMSLLGLCIHSCSKRRVAGFLGLAVAVILAPSSSLVPLAGEFIAEHRMVLPLAPLLALVVLFANRLLRPSKARAPWLAPALLALVLAGLSATTIARNRDYRSALVLWQDTTKKRPANSRAWNQLGLAQRDEGQAAAAEASFSESIRLEPRVGMAQFNLGNLLVSRGMGKTGVYWLREALERRPRDARVHFGLGTVLINNHEPAAGVQHLERAIDLQPGWLQIRARLAWLRATHPEASLRRGGEALQAAHELLARGGKRPRFLDILAAAQAEVGDFVKAQASASEAARVARSEGKQTLAQQIDARQALYAAEQPFRQP